MSTTFLACPGCKAPVKDRRNAPRAWRTKWYECPSCGLITEQGQFVEQRNITVAKGGILGGQASSVAFGRTALGTGTGTNSSGTFTAKAGVTIRGGSTLVVFIHYDPTNQILDGVSFGATGMTQVGAAQADGSALFNTDCWVLQNCAGGTADVTITSALAIPTWEAVIVEVTGAAASSLDKNNSAGGTSASPSSGASGTTSQANELVLGCVGWSSATVAGTWSNSFTAGQQASAAAGTSIESSYRFVTAIGSYTAAKTGATNTNWAALVVTFKAA